MVELDPERYAHLMQGRQHAGAALADGAFGSRRSLSACEPRAFSAAGAPTAVRAAVRFRRPLSRRL